MPDPDPSAAIRAPSGATPASGGLPGASPPFPVPDHTLIRRVGKGAYGEVWLARNALGTWRAVKFIRRSSFDDDRPFERELAGIQRFEPISRSHESQLNILHVGRAEDGFYYVMELADDMGRGQDIDEATYTPRNLRSELHVRGRLPVAECLRLGLALTTALEHLHKHGLVHRDIKPSNIVFVNGIPKLADIGLVARAEATISFVGTEGFLPPEGPGTRPADIFSLGKVLYEISTGHDRQQFPELPTNIVELPDRAELSELNEVLLRACHRDPKERYQNAAEMHADLALLESGRSVVRLRGMERRLRFVQRAGAVVTVIAALAAGLYLWQARQTRIVTELAKEKSILAVENRERLVRLNIANGVREIEQGQPGRALGWLADALALSTNNPTDAAVQSIRINLLLDRHPRLLHVFPHPGAVSCSAFTPDEKGIATACEDGKIRIWDIDSDEVPVKEFQPLGPVSKLRFTADGRSLFVVERSRQSRPARVALLDATTGYPLFPPVTEVTSAALSHDDRWLAVGRSDFSIELVVATNGQVVARAGGHKDRIEMMSFSPDSSMLISAARDRTVRRWDVSTGNPIDPPLLHDYPVLRAVFNADGTRIATATSAEQSNEPIHFQTWVAKTGKVLGRPVRGEGVHPLVSFDRTGIYLLTCDREPVVRVWNADSHAVAAPPQKMDGSGRCMDVSPDGGFVAVASETGTVHIWDTETGFPAFAPLPGSSRTESIEFSKDGSRLLTAGTDGTVRIWDLALPPPDVGVVIPAPTSSSVSFTADGRQMLMGVSGFQDRVQLIDFRNPKPMIAPLPASTNFVYSGKVIMDRTGDQWTSGIIPIGTGVRHLSREVGHKTTNLGLWRREQGHIRYCTLPHPARIGDAFFHRDGHQLLTMSADRLARTWNTADGSLQQTQTLPEEDAAWIAVSPDFETAVALTGDERGWRVVLRDTKTGRTIHELTEANPDVRALAFSPDGDRLGIVGGNLCNRIWATKSGKPLTKCFDHVGTLTCIEWSPDGRRVLTAGTSPEVRVWDAATGELALPPMVMMLKPVELARFSPDGRFIVARCDERFIRVWDATTGDSVSPILAHRDTIKSVCMTADLKVVSVQNSGEIRVWNLDETTHSPQDLSDYARLLTGESVATPVLRAPASASELAALLHSLRARQPGWFDASFERQLAWHRHMARKTNWLSTFGVALFHLQRLAQLAPNELPMVREQITRCRALMNPVRDPATPPQLLDLSRAYTSSFELLRWGELAGLPRGRQKLDGTEFDLRGVIYLGHAGDPGEIVGSNPPSLRIPVGLPCRTLQFLQATVNDPLVEGGIVARWIIHYSDGSSREWPVIYGEQVRDLVWIPEREPLDARQAKLAWSGPTAIGLSGNTVSARLFKATWVNPLPNVEIERLELRVGETAQKPIVVAITAE